SAWKKGDDLKIQRINLDDLFIPLTLNRDRATTTQPGNYSIDGSATNAVPEPAPFTAYFLDGTRVSLLDLTTPAALEYSEILHRSKSFTFVLGSWRAERFIGRTIQHPDALDMQIAADAFLSANNSPYAAGNPPATTGDVYNAMIAYMSNYVIWA